MRDRADPINIREFSYQGIDDRFAIDRRLCEYDPNLFFKIEPSCDAFNDRFKLTAAVRHLLQEGGNEAQSCAFPEVGDADDVKGYEPALTIPNLLSKRAD